MTTVTAPVHTDKSAPADTPPAGTIAIPVGEHVALVDEADAELVAGHRWRPWTSETGKTYAYTVIGRSTVYMHRRILGTAAGFDTDHRDGDGLNNRRANLRSATRAQNVANTPKSRRRDGRPRTSIFKGVSWNRTRGRWQVTIKCAGESIFLGRFDDEAGAARAYDAAAFEAWGEFAHLNFPAEVAR